MQSDKECCGKCEDQSSSPTGVKTGAQFINQDKMSFYLGLAIGIGAISLIGFLFLLMRGNISNKSVSVDDDVVNVVKPAKVDDAPSRAAQPTSVKIASVKSSDHINGNPKAPLTIIEYSDLECPFCKRFHPSMQRLVKEYDGKVKWIYRHFPLSFHLNAQKEAEATECANKLGGNKAFWAYLDAVIDRTKPNANGTGFELDKLVPLAKELGLNASKFKKCLDSGEFTEYVKGDIALGSSEGISGTPGNILIKKDGSTSIIPGAVPYEDLQAAIEAALK